MKCFMRICPLLIVMKQRLLLSLASMSTFFVSLLNSLAPGSVIVTTFEQVVT